MHLADLGSSVVARSIIGCAARPSSASRYNRHSRHISDWDNISTMRVIGIRIMSDAYD